MWPSLRQPSVRTAASMMLVLGCVGLIAAAESDFSLDLAAGHGLSRGFLGYRDAVDTVMDETTGSLGPIGAQRAAAALSDEDRFRIYEGVMRMPDAPVAEAPAPDVAEALPDEVPMQELPLSVLRRLPQVAGLKFAKFDDRIVVVNPASRIVVAMIPRYKLMP
jgi:hypothetical protein